jgi:glycosyltransferase involved in cell wall biosynthesis
MGLVDRQICLVTPAHVSANPRLVKEADALHAAGCRVHVVCGRYYPPLDEFDRAILARAGWKHTVVDYTAGVAVAGNRVLRRLARKLGSRVGDPSPALAARAHHAAILALAAAAARERAELYVGHCLAGLAAAGLAAQRTGAKLGFDAEDFHSAETVLAETDPAESRSVRALEAHWLPRCAHITASSPQIARAYADTYGLSTEPATLLNVFPLALAPHERPAPPPNRPLRLYWFSQTIGAGRGLEELIVALGRMRMAVSLHLRGVPAPGFPDSLRSLARTHRWEGEIEFLPFGPPDEMPALAAGHDLGLSLEQRTPRNRDLCLTNKIFTYLLAGLPVALSPTTAQDALRPALGEAALPLPLQDPAACAAMLDDFASDSSRRAAAAARARQLSRELYNWDRQQETLLRRIAQVLH